MKFSKKKDSPRAVSETAAKPAETPRWPIREERGYGLVDDYIGREKLDVVLGKGKADAVAKALGWFDWRHQPHEVLKDLETWKAAEYTEAATYLAESLAVIMDDFGNEPEELMRIIGNLNELSKHYRENAKLISEKLGDWFRYLVPTDEKSIPAQCVEIVDTIIDYTKSDLKNADRYIAHLDAYLKEGKRYA